MALQPDNSLTLADGRVLAWAEWGDPSGTPVLHFHGTPSSRLEAALPGFDEVAVRLGVRVLAPDRPGIGRSDPKPSRTLLDWAADVAEFADQLGLSRVSVYGVSGGGPYAAACAYRIAHRLRAAGIVSGLAPFEVAEGRRGMGLESRVMFFLARYAGWALRPLVRRTARQLGGLSVERIGAGLKGLPEADQRVLGLPGRIEAFLASMREAFRQGEVGVWTDLRVISRPWGFDLSDVPMVMNLWFGGQDRNVPPAAGRYLASAFGRSEARYYPEEGHVSLLSDRYEEILSGLIATGVREGDTPILEA